MPTLAHARATQRRRPDRARAARRPGSGGRALCRGAAAGAGRADRPRTIRTIRSRASSCPTRPNSTCAGGKRRSDRRRCPQPGRRHRASLSRPRAAQADACLRGLLPLLLPPRNGRARQAERAVARRRWRARSIISARMTEIWEVILTGGDPLVLSARRLRAVMKELSAIDHVKVVRIHTRVPVAEPERITPELVRALKASGQGDLRRRARQSCARTDAGGARRLRAHGRCRPGAARAIGAARRRQRQCRSARRADAGAGRMPGQAVLPAPRRSRARHRASAHRHRDRAGADARLARARCRACASRLTCSTFPAATANRRSGRTTSTRVGATAPRIWWLRITTAAGTAIRRQSIRRR